MAVVFMDGFDWYTTADFLKRWTDGGGNVVIGPTYARSVGGQGLLINGSNVPVPTKSFGSNYTAGLVGFAWQYSSTNSRTILTLTDGTTEQCSIRTNASSVITVNQGSNVRATGTTVLSPNTWYYIEFKATVSSSGVAEVKLNGASEIASTSSLDLTGTANNYFNGIIFGVRNASTGNCQIDDVYVLDTTTGSNTGFLGPIQVVARYPTANGNSSSWTPNGGTNMGCVSETFSDGDASFNQSSTANQIDTFTMQDLPVASGSVYAVAHYMIARQDTGAARSIAPVMRPATTDRVGTTVNLSTSYQAFCQIYDTSPETSSAWDVAGVNSLEAGYKLIS